MSKKAWRTGGSRMFIDVNSHVRVEDLVRGMLIQSGNDASTALAEHVAGSVEAFVALMNEKAAALGMKSSVFKNPTGLPARGHVSSAHDLGDSREGHHFDISEVLRALRRARVQLQRDHAAEPQRAAFARPRRRRHEDRVHGRGGILHRELGAARRHAADRGGARRDSRRRSATTRRRRCSSTASRTSRRTGCTRPASRSAPRASRAARPRRRRSGSSTICSSRFRAARTPRSRRRPTSRRSSRRRCARAHASAR